MKAYVNKKQSLIKVVDASICDYYKPLVMWLLKLNDTYKWS